MPAELIDAVVNASAETIAWGLLAAFAAYFIAVYGSALRARSQGARMRAPITYVLRVMREDARLMWVGFGSLAAGVFAFAFQFQNFGAALAGVIEMVPALWAGTALFGVSLSNAIGYTQFPPLWVIILMAVFGLVAYLLRTLDIEMEDE